LNFVYKEKDALCIDKINETDGIQLLFEDGSSILYRPSGTEPKMRIYIEGTSIEKIEQLSQTAMEIFRKASDRYVN